MKMAVGLSIVLPSAGQFYNYEISKSVKCAFLFYSSLCLVLNFVVYRLFAYVFSLIGVMISAIMGSISGILGSIIPSGISPSGISSSLHFPSLPSLPSPPLSSFIYNILSTTSYVLYSDFFMAWSSVWILGLYVWLIFDSYSIANQINRMEKRRGASRKKQVSDLLINLTSLLLSFIPHTGFEFISYFIHYSKIEYEKAKEQREEMTGKRMIDVSIDIFKLSLTQFGKSYLTSLLFQLLLLFSIFLYLLFYIVIIILWIFNLY